MAVFLGGCGSEQSVQQSDPGPDTVSPSPVAESPAIPDPEPAATGPVVEPVVVSDPLSLEPTLDAALPSSTGANSEESIDDILAELNAIKLEGEGDSPLGDPDKVVALMNEGNALISAGKPDAALAKYNEALKFAENGEDPEVFFNRGIAYKVKGEIDKAAAEYERALEVTPKYAEALNNLGNIRKDQKQYDEAIRCLELSIEVFPDNPNTYNNLGTVFAMKGNFNKAAVYFTKAVRLQPSYIDARQNLGLAYQQQGRLDVAEKEFGEVLQMTRGMMLREEKRLEAARVMVDQAKKPGSPLTFEQRNKAGGELDAAEQASRMTNAKYQQSLNKAAAEYERALEVTPKYAEALNNLGNIRKDQKQYDEAIRCLELSIEVFPDNPNTYNNLGTVFAMKGNFNKAAFYFTKAVRLQPSYIDARQNLGQAYQKQGRLDVAEKEFGEVLQMTRGMMLRQKKRLEAARVMVDQAKKPGSPLTFEQRNQAGGELDAAEQASRMANAKYQRSLKLLQNIRVRR